MLSFIKKSARFKRFRIHQIITNFELTKQLFDAFLNSEASVIFTFTAADEVLGVLTEEITPKTHYGIAKLQAERYILSHVYLRRKDVLRPCMSWWKQGNLLYQLVAKDCLGH
jgi:nucleoside-diphosphate-sugar epimerase